ncbi:MAG: radical SAM protein [Candidatus Thorarchaeota archaeon]|jgi:radical SAM protein (TIGR04043 family)
MDAEDILRLKVRLLTEGAFMPEDKFRGRKGGAGPVGAMYFLLPNGRPCGIPIRQGKLAERYSSASLEETGDPNVWLYDGLVKLELIPKPKFYNRVTSDGIPYHHIALLHGSRTLATTVYQGCKYWDRASQCKFCTIPHSYTSGNTVLEKTPEQIVEVVLAAEQEGVIDDVLLTTGTTESPDMGCAILIRIIEAIRESSSIPIGVQFEPPVDSSIISEVAKAGANAVAMHIESTDESVRKEMSPGKHQYGSLDFYRERLKFALEHFAHGNVSTYVLHGLGEDREQTLEVVEELASIGVLPIVAPIRPAAGSQLVDYIPTYVNNLETSIEFYKKIGLILYRNGINPEKTIAGCHRCGGCTPEQEAYDWAAQAHPG